MKTILKTSKCIFFTILLFTFSCSSDDGGGGSSGINAVNLVTNFDENPAVGATVGTIQASSGNTLSFSITAQTPSGALSINPSTGELKVANANAFDFETNPILSATISILDLSDTTSVTATININNLDDIASFLSTSEAAYTAAADGDWVIVTETEYNSLASNLNEISRIGTTEAEYTDSNMTNQSNMPQWIASNITSATVPSDSYVFAFKYNAFDVVNATTTKVKLSTTSGSDGYVDLGSTLPSHSGAMEDVYFVLKGNMDITSNLGYLAILKAENSIMGLKNITGNQSYYWASGDTNSGLAQFDDNKILYQGLSTTQKQW